MCHQQAIDSKVSMEQVFEACRRREDRNQAGQSLTESDYRCYPRSPQLKQEGYTAYDKTGRRIRRYKCSERNPFEDGNSVLPSGNDGQSGNHIQCGEKAGYTHPVIEQIAHEEPHVTASLNFLHQRP
jgi:hypothetical protein